MTAPRGKVLMVRPMPGANCSSVGSVVDLLFASGVVGAALLVAVTATLDDEIDREAERSGTEPPTGSSIERLDDGRASSAPGCEREPQAGVETGHDRTGGARDDTDEEPSPDAR